jgi:hypothetical protein
MSRRARFVRTRFPSIGISLSKVAMAAFMLFAGGLTRFDARTVGFFRFIVLTRYVMLADVIKSAERQHRPRISLQIQRARYSVSL